MRDLLDLLCDLGARIEGINTNRVTVTRRNRRQDGDRRLPAVPRTTVDISGFIVAAGMTGWPDTHPAAPTCPTS